MAVHQTMTPIIVLPVPMETPEVWALFKPHVRRFAETFRLYHKGWSYRIVVMVNGSEPSDELRELFRCLEVSYFRHDDKGTDVGAWQETAARYPTDFLVCCTSRVFFNQDGWLGELLVAREVNGPGLYSTSASMEGGVKHLCIRCVGVDAHILNEYPHRITSRDQGCFFEIGRDNPLGPFSDWVLSQGYVAKAVYWSGAYDKDEWLKPDNIFRRGDQSNLLVADKHSDLWANAPIEERDRLSRICFEEE